MIDSAERAASEARRTKEAFGDDFGPRFVGSGVVLSTSRTFTSESDSGAKHMAMSRFNLSTDVMTTCPA